MLTSYSPDSITPDPEVSEVPEVPKKHILDEYINFGYFYIPFMLCQQLMVLVLTSSFLFTTFGSQMPTILKCGEENFESISLTYRCNHSKELHASGYNCTPEYDNNVWSLPQELKYYCNTAYDVKWATVVQKIGHLFGAVIAGQLSDMFGRKKVLIVGIIGMLGSFLGVSFTVDLVWYSVAMFFMAVFSSCLITVDTVYFVEMVPMKYADWSLMFIGFSPNVIVFAGLAWISHDFRTLARVCAGITAVLLVMKIWCPESARWLLQKQKLEEAKNVVKRIHKWNRTLTDKKSIELDLAFSKEGQDIARQEEIENEINPNSRKKFYFYHLFLTQTMSKQTLTLCFVHFVFYIYSHEGLYSMEHFSGNIFVNVAIMGGTLWLTNILYGMVVLYFNVPKSRVTYFVIALITTFCIPVYIFKHFAAHVFAFDVTCYTILGALSFNVLIISGVVTAEVFPTLVRGSAVGMVQFCGGVGMILTLMLKSDKQESFNSFTGTFFLTFCILIWVHYYFEKNVLEPNDEKPMDDKMPDKSEWMWRRRE